MNPADRDRTFGAGAAEPLLSVRDLHVEIDTEDGVLTAVNRMGFDLYAGEVLAIVGESGCGKTMTALSILGLLPRKAARVVRGEVRLGGEDLLAALPQRMRQVRGAEIAMIFQEPLTALNPVQRVGDQIAEMIRTHRPVRRSEARRRAAGLLDRVGIPDAARRARRYPHELSGGMRQRVMIAMAITLEPAVLIADEPTTALDATVQAQVLEVLSDVQRGLSGAMVLITHDIGVVADLADRVVVMYAGRSVEQGSVYDVFERPLHPYTAGLLGAVPRVDGTADRLNPITGTPPPSSSFPMDAPSLPAATWPPRSAWCRSRNPGRPPARPGRRPLPATMRSQVPGARWPGARCQVPGARCLGSGARCSRCLATCHRRPIDT